MKKFTELCEEILNEDQDLSRFGTFIRAKGSTEKWVGAAYYIVPSHTEPVIVLIDGKYVLAKFDTSYKSKSKFRTYYKDNAINDSVSAWIRVPKTSDDVWKNVTEIPNHSEEILIIDQNDRYHIGKYDKQTKSFEDENGKKIVGASAPLRWIDIPDTTKRENLKSSFVDSE